MSLYPRLRPKLPSILLPLLPLRPLHRHFSRALPTCPPAAAARHFQSSSRPHDPPSQTAAEPLIRRTDIPAPNTGHIRVLELNRPAARNAISKALLAGLRTEIDLIGAQYTEDGHESGSAEGLANGPTRAVVLASAVDSCFCAGADLKERKGFTAEETKTFLTTLRTTLTTLSALPVPTISAISSLALGGGLELALSTHLRVLASTALLALPETRLAILPGAGATFRLPALIGLSRARDLILTGRRVAAPEAYFLGIADRLVEVEVLADGGANANATGTAPPAAAAAAKEAADTPSLARRMVLAEAVRLAGEICEGGPVAVRAALRAVGWAREEVENEMYERVVGTEDRDEALRAFAEKRKPVFKGR